VLLFAADAQVGNWLSWYDQTYKPNDGRELTAENLLENTVLYKVGHHGSHNATLREKGLEAMTHRELVAMLPVESEGVKRLKYGEMPLTSLVQALTKKTSGRLLRLDEDWQNGVAPGSGPNWIRPRNQRKRSRSLKRVKRKNADFTWNIRFGMRSRIQSNGLARQRDLFYSNTKC